MKYIAYLVFDSRLDPMTHGSREIGLNHDGGIRRQNCNSPSIDCGQNIRAVGPDAL